MIISIASGKGGTGKTTIATNLAASLDQPVQLIDCDVEEPNGHIFMKPQFTSQETVNRMVPLVNMDLCDLCGECDKICQFSAIALVGKTVLTFPEMCHSCKGCMMVCPHKAISETPVELGELQKGTSGNVEFIHGRLKVGEAMAPPLINRVKKEINSNGITILDAPPGTSCPVVTTIKDSDFVILVTEPTPFGLNDLRLAVEVTRVVNTNFGIIINRCNVGDNKTKEYVEKENIPILMEIPDLRNVAEAYSRGDMLINIMPEMKDEFKSLYARIAKNN
ncbi:ATP-binding protein [Candidatus Magnetomoraceae bacterium gMMP-15]